MNPYNNIPHRQFWKSAVSNLNLHDISDLWRPKFTITSSASFATYGSCFAQHFSKALVTNGLSWINEEKAPKFVSHETSASFNYNVYSSRTQNIYTPTMLLQWAKATLDGNFPSDEFWEKDGRFYDPIRPTVEPFGFETPLELMQSRSTAIMAFKRSIQKANIFVFTLGLCERWMSIKSGLEFAHAPGVSSGQFNPKKHKFECLYWPELREALANSLDIIQSINPSIKFILTVSPVPLTATYKNQNVLVSTIEAKSNLRAVAGFLAKNRANVEYFPSFEVISSFPYRGVFYEPNLRQVNQAGVDLVMQHFFNSTQISSKNINRNGEEGRTRDVLCEEELLGAFNK